MGSTDGAAKPPALLRRPGRSLPLQGGRGWGAGKLKSTYRTRYRAATSPFQEEVLVEQNLKTEERKPEGRPALDA
jgi:hypothetical protein